METDFISIDEFKKIQLKTAEIISAENIEGSKKLLKLKIRLGEEERTLAAGIAEFYSPGELVGRTIVIVANLQPRALRGIESQGMLLAVQDGEKLALLAPDKKISSGLTIE